MASKERILVIDDEEVIRDSCTQALAKVGYVVKSAENADKGLELLQSFDPGIVLVDLKMPGKSGIEVLEEIQAKDPNIIKIVITGFATVSSAIDAMKKGAYDFIPKPFTPEEIRVIVARGLERRQLLLESEALRLEQERTRKNMISLVSHEFRAPLAATIQYLEVILGGMAGDISSEAKEMIERCDIRLREMLELLGRWISLAIFDADKLSENFKDINLKDLASESIDVLRSMAEEKNISLILDSPEDLPTIKGNKISIGEVFNNLISNGIKYNKEGGWVKISLSEANDCISVKISDNGMGIDNEHLSKIFDEFYRVDGRRNAPVKGSGLGLSIVKKMVNAHGGTIDVESEIGKGSVFKIDFPKVFESENSDKKEEDR
ncbi:MAG: response regulator [Deltaproteobacteria bacterium]|nr:response regulator [Deltaproteobacteria bacterium]